MQVPLVQVMLKVARMKQQLWGRGWWPCSPHHWPQGCLTSWHGPTSIHYTDINQHYLTPTHYITTSVCPYLAAKCSGVLKIQSCLTSDVSWLLRQPQSVFSPLWDSLSKLSLSKSTRQSESYQFSRAATNCSISVFRIACLLETLKFNANVSRNL